MATKTQNEKILTYLGKGKPLTADKAYDKFGVVNLRARINELRQEGFKIFTNKTGYRMPSR